jgi:glycosyltransferase involved in cell wall biosynthesis
MDHADQKGVEAQMTAPLVSVILPTHNRAKTLRRAIDSVLMQTYRELELVIIDDGSTDETSSLLASYDDPRIKLLTPGRLGSAAKARNHGLKHARGEFVAFQDSDDVWLVEKLARQVAFAQEHPQTAMTVCGYILYFVGQAPRYYGKELLDDGHDFRSLFSGHGSPISTPAWLVRRDALVQLGGFDETLNMWEDWELSIRLEAYGRFQMLNEPLVLQFGAADSVNRNAAMRSLTVETVMKKHPQWLSPSRRVRANHARRFMMFEVEAGQIGRAWHYLLQALAYDPFYWKTWASIALRLPRLLRLSAA